MSIVSFFSQTTGLVLRLQSFENKIKLEIKQVQEQVLTETTHGQVFTLDALHCQKQTTTLITKYKNDYIISMKRNPKKLFKAAVKLKEI